MMTACSKRHAVFFLRSSQSNFVASSYRLSHSFTLVCPRVDIVQSGKYHSLGIPLVLYGTMLKTRSVTWRLHLNAPTPALF